MHATVDSPATVISKRFASTLPGANGNGSESEHVHGSEGSSHPLHDLGGQLECRLSWTHPVREGFCHPGWTRQARHDQSNRKESRGDIGPPGRLCEPETPDRHHRPLPIVIPDQTETTSAACRKTLDEYGGVPSNAARCLAHCFVVGARCCVRLSSSCSSLAAVST